MEVRDCISACDNDNPLDKKIVGMPLRMCKWELNERFLMEEWENHHVHQLQLYQFE